MEQICNPFSLAGKTILVTGASSGIGRACAIECSKMGARIIITGRNLDKLHETHTALCGKDHVEVPADLIDEEQIRNLARQVPGLDGLVLNAGINDKSLVKFMDAAKIQKMLNTNFISNVLLIQSLLKAKKLHKKCSVVFMSSISAYYPTIGNGLYAASKGAINSFSKVLALELLPILGRVNCIQPAFIDTEMLEKYVLQEEIQKIRDNYPLGRFARPEEVAHAVIYFLSDASEWVTGNLFIMDGGFTLR